MIDHQLALAFEVLGSTHPGAVLRHAASLVKPVDEPAVLAVLALEGDHSPHLMGDDAFPWKRRDFLAFVAYRKKGRF